MAAVLFKSAILLAINIGCGMTYAALLDWNRHFQSWETGSALYRIPAGEQFDWLLLGSSHAEVFCHCPENVVRVQAALGGDVSFVTKRGSGVFQHRLFLREFYRDGNRADTVVLFVDPWSFFSRHWNETMRFIEYEPLDISFSLDLVRAGVSPSALLFYVRSKFRRDWYAMQPAPPDAGACLRRLNRRNSHAVKRSVRRFFPKGVDAEELERYMDELRGIITLIHTHDSNVVLVSAPTLLGDLPGAEEFRTALDGVLAPQGIPYHDFSNVVTDPALFHDHDHLNDNGVQYFLDEYLASALRKQ